MSAIDVRAARSGDLTDLVTVLGRAFRVDPVMSWMLPDPDTRERRLGRMFGTFTRHHHLGCGASLVAVRDGAIGAVALWDPPGRWQPGQLAQLRMTPTLVGVFGRHLRRGMTVDEAMIRAHPAEPHWYLPTIGSDPDVRGGGFGHALMVAGLRRVDADHAPAYLESSNPDNEPYYRRFGFEATGRIELGADADGAPVGFTTMWRRPR